MLLGWLSFFLAAAPLSIGTTSFRRCCRCCLRCRGCYRCRCDANGTSLFWVEYNVSACGGCAAGDAACNYDAKKVLSHGNRSAPFEKDGFTFGCSCFGSDAFVTMHTFNTSGQLDGQFAMVRRPRPVPWLLESLLGVGLYTSEDGAWVPAAGPRAMPGFIYKAYTLNTATGLKSQHPTRLPPHHPPHPHTTQADGSKTRAKCNGAAQATRLSMSGSCAGYYDNTTKDGSVVEEKSRRS